MAVIAKTSTRLAGGIYRIAWLSIGNADQGTQENAVTEMAATVQVTGTFGGATLLVEGTLDGTTWATLNDVQGNPLSFTTARIEEIQEYLVTAIRVSTTGGAGTSLNAYLVFRNRAFD